MIRRQCLYEINADGTRVYHQKVPEFLGSTESQKYQESNLSGDKILLGELRRNVEQSKTINERERAEKERLERVERFLQSARTKFLEIRTEVHRLYPPDDQDKKKITVDVLNRELSRHLTLLSKKDPEFKKQFSRVLHQMYGMLSKTNEEGKDIFILDSVKNDFEKAVKEGGTLSQMMGKLNIQRGTPVGEMDTILKEAVFKNLFEFLNQAALAPGAAFNTWSTAKALQLLFILFLMDTKEEYHRVYWKDSGETIGDNTLALRLLKTILEAAATPIQ